MLQSQQSPTSSVGLVGGGISSRQTFWEQWFLITGTTALSDFFHELTKTFNGHFFRKSLTSCLYRVLQPLATEFSVYNPSLQCHIRVLLTSLGSQQHRFLPHNVLESDLHRMFVLPDQLLLEKYVKNYLRRHFFSTKIRKAAKNHLK